MKVVIYDDRRINSMSRLIDIDELANYLKLKRQTLYNWLNQGKISGMKVGGVWRFDRKDVDNWLKSRKRLNRPGDKQ
jgi:excisionase family DNA binding protein